MTPENIVSLHQHEEKIRVDSLGIIDTHQNLRDHLDIVHESMAIIYALAHDHANLSDDELIIQYLGLRLFNSAASALKLGLSGYYQSAFSLVRDIVETSELLDYLHSNLNQIAVWKVSDKKQRIAQFGPSFIRNALNIRDRLSGNKRKEIYDRLSEYASHATAPGFQLIAREGIGEIGPFWSEQYLKALLEEKATRLTYGATIFMSHFSNVESPLLLQEKNFMEHANHWRNKYIAGSK